MDRVDEECASLDAPVRQRLGCIEDGDSLLSERRCDTLAKLPIGRRKMEPVAVPASEVEGLLARAFQLLGREQLAQRGLHNHEESRISRARQLVESLHVRHVAFDRAINHFGVATSGGLASPPYSARKIVLLRTMLDHHSISA